ncbi:hypothetical protein FB451DRAFT_1516827 [Mycena latifolia]|nr:hypothetical protein FB451DRAFT_1516827 [Mycena latifolia]
MSSLSETDVSEFLVKLTTAYHGSTTTVQKLQTQIKQKEDASATLLAESSAHQRATKVLNKNNELDETCVELEAEIKRLKQEKEEDAVASLVEIRNFCAALRIHECLPIPSGSQKALSPWSSLQRTGNVSRAAGVSSLSMLRSLFNYGKGTDIQQEGSAERITNSVLFLLKLTSWTSGERLHALIYLPTISYDSQAAAWTKTPGITDLDDKTELFVLDKDRFGREQIFYAGVYKSCVVPSNGRVTSEFALALQREAAPDCDLDEVKTAFRAAFPGQAWNAHVVGMQCAGFNLPLYDALRKEYKESKASEASGFVSGVKRKAEEELLGQTAAKRKVGVDRNVSLVPRAVAQGDSDSDDSEEEDEEEDDD